MDTGNSVFTDSKVMLWSGPDVARSPLLCWLTLMLCVRVVNRLQDASPPPSCWSENFYFGSISQSAVFVSKPIHSIVTWYSDYLK